MKNKILCGCLLMLITTTPVSSGSLYPKGCLEADIIFLLDFSGSVAGYEDFITDALKSFVLTTELSREGVQVGYVVFSSYLRQTVELTDLEPILLNFIGMLENMQADGGTSLVAALEKSQTYFSESEKIRGKKVLQIIVCVSDGQFGDMHETIHTAHVLKNNDVKIFCIQTATEYQADGMRILKQIATDENYYFSSDYVSLTETIQRLDICM